MVTAIYALTGIEVEVSRFSIDVNGGMEWRVTFPAEMGDVVLMRADDELDRGIVSIAAVSEGAVSEVQRIHLQGINLIQGSFGATFGGESTQNIPCDVSAKGLKTALEKLNTVGRVHVTRSGLSRTHGYTWDITYASNAGNLPKLEVLILILHP